MKVAVPLAARATCASLALLLALISTMMNSPAVAADAVRPTVAAPARKPAVVKQVLAKPTANTKPVMAAAPSPERRALPLAAASVAAGGVLVSANATKKNAKASAQDIAREGQAESRLIDVYKLIGDGQTTHALTKAEALVRKFPNFQLAQLVYGDLLMFRSRPVRMPGDIADAAARGAAPALADLREESLMRLKALRERPPPGTIPSQFLMLSQRNKHALAVDASRSRIYLFEHRNTGLALIADFYISVGKAGIGKETEGDLRTPLGVYYITNSIAPKMLKDFYGTGALPINYPNPLDLRRGKTGSGIWLHGTPPTQFSRPPKASDGCVVLANPDLDYIANLVEIRDTPVVIAQSLNWVQPHSVRPDANEFETTLQGWRAAKSSGDLQRTMRYYSIDFNNDGKDLLAWTPQVRKEIDLAPGRPLNLKDLSYLRWNDGNTDTMVVTFDEVIDGNAKGPKKRQYWLRQGSQWKIFFEGIIG